MRFLPKFSSGIENSSTLKVKWLVLRTPMDLLISALHTEFLGGWNRKGNSLKEKELLNDIININSHSHWHCELFKNLYLFGVSLSTPPTIVMLHHLNDFLTKEMSIEELPIFDKTEYNFSNDSIWLSKSKIKLYLSKTYPEQWIKINTLLINDELFWYKIQNQFPIWK